MSLQFNACHVAIKQKRIDFRELMRNSLILRALGHVRLFYEPYFFSERKVFFSLFREPIYLFIYNVWSYSLVVFIDGNVSGANQPICVTVQTSNLGHMILIQGGARGVGGGFAKV
jgi:hypothetical protein